MTREQAELVAEALRLLLRAVELEAGHERQEQAPTDEREAEAEADLRKAGLI